MRAFIYTWIAAIFISVPQLAHAVAIGSPVDEFSLRDLSGTTHTPADYRGQVLILAVIGYN